MNQKTAKLIRTYVGFRKSKGKAIALKDVKRRYRAAPAPDRYFIKDAMRSFLETYYTGTDPAALRALRPAWGKKEVPRGPGIMGMLAAFLGFR